MDNLAIKQRNLSLKPRILREKGIVPGALYGPGVQTTPIEAQAIDVWKAQRRAGEIYKVKTAKGKEVMVKFEEIQKDPLTRELIHFTLLQLPEGQENDVTVPINLVGTPEGVKEGGVLVALQEEVLIYGKPKLIPQELEVDVSNLSIGDKVTLNELNIPKKVALSEKEQEDNVIAICQPPRSLKAEDEEEKEETSSELLDETENEETSKAL